MELYLTNVKHVTSHFQGQKMLHTMRRIAKSVCVWNVARLSNKVALKRHSKAIHLERHKCKVCNKLFAAQSSLKRHLNVHAYNQEKKFGCEHCNAKFTTKFNMIRHVKKCM